MMAASSSDFFNQLKDDIQGYSILPLMISEEAKSFIQNHKVNQDPPEFRASVCQMAASLYNQSVLGYHPLLVCQIDLGAIKKPLDDAYNQVLASGSDC
jgi:hypothetical protein